MHGKSKKIGLLVIACIILVLFIVIITAPRNSSTTNLKEDSNDAYKYGSGRIPTVIITDINGPFTIAYAGVDAKGFNHIQVSDSAPKGRQAAIKWLENAGYDISTIGIDFVDFNNPLKLPNGGQ